MHRGVCEMAFQQFKDSFDFVLEEARRGKPGRIDALVHAELGGPASTRITMRFTSANHPSLPTDSLSTRLTSGSTWRMRVKIRSTSSAAT
jgi:hypothetical protein